MPVYEFRCEACGPFDAHHAMAQVPRSQDCPACGADARRVFSAVGLSRAMVAEYFPGMQSRISGIGLHGIQHKLEEVHALGFDGDAFGCGKVRVR